MKKIITASLMAVFMVLMLSAVLSNVALALTNIPAQELPNTLITDSSGFLRILTIIVNWVFTIFVILAILFVLLAAFQFITAGGEPEKISEARQKLIWAAIGIIVALIARGLPAVVSNIIGAGSGAIQQ